MAIRISPADFPREIEARLLGTPGAIIRGLNRGAMEGQRILVQRTPRATGSTAARWRVKRGKGRTPPELENLAPHVGILDLGARPHPVSAEGLAALVRWAQLQLGLTRAEAVKAASAIAWKIRKKGAKPTYFVRDSMGDLRDAAARGVAYEIAVYARMKAIT